MFHVKHPSRGAEQHSNLDGQPAWIPPITISSRTEHGLLVANSLPSMERRVWWVLCSDVSRGTSTHMIFQFALADKSPDRSPNVSRETLVLDGSLKTVLNGKVFDAVSGWF